MDYQKIVWLSSYPKSGNTWLRLLIDAYLLQKEPDINNILGSVADDNSLRHAIGLPGHDVREMPIDIQGLTRPMSLLRLVLEFNDGPHPDLPCFVKTHTANILANGIELLPAALTKAVICLVRDPRDVVFSYAKHMGIDIDQAIERMNDRYQILQTTQEHAKVSDVISSWGKNVSSYLQGDCHNIRLFKYEELKKEPEVVFSAMLEHAGIDPDPERVKKAVEFTQLSKLQAQEAKKGFSESSPHAKNQFFGKGESGTWKDKLTPLQKRRIEKYFGPVMKKLGYIDKVRRIA